MKKIFFSLLTLFCFHITQAQILKKIKEKVDNKVNNTVEKKADDVVNGKKEDQPNSNDDNNDNTASDKKTEAIPASLKTYSKYDFVPGEKIIVYEDFMQDAVGDLPDKWNTNSAGEIVTVEGKEGHWFKLTKPGWFMPDFIDSLPQDFTLEYDFFADAPVHSWGISTSLAQLKNRDKPDDEQQHVNSFTVNILPGLDARGSTNYGRIKNGVGEQATTTQTGHFIDITRPCHIAIWKQKERLRIYFDEDKAWDVPKAFLAEAKLNSVYFWMQLSDNWHFYIGNIRLAVGAPDTRKKILEQNKWVTHGILFDVNSDKIKPESYGTLKEMASVLKDYPDLKVTIVGHTDSDGSDAANLDLSKKRAAAVKESLAKEFGIDDSRMETDGKGETEPIDKNDTPAGKANNRRVEFIKI